MLSSKDKETVLKCVSAGYLPDVLNRADIEIETFKKREPGSTVFVNKETGELVTYAQMKEAGGLEREKVEIEREEPVQHYFERDIDKDTVTCPMGQTLFYEGPGCSNGKKDYSVRRYHRVSVCAKCKNKCTIGKRRVISFKEGETKKPETFYKRAKQGKISKKANHAFKQIQLSEEESTWSEFVILRFYPNQKHLRERNTVVEHPYGTVKRWHGAGFVLTKGKEKVSGELGPSFLAYNFRRVINILGVKELMSLISA